MMILIFLKPQSSAGASERCSASSPRPARSRQRESRCAVGRGQEARDQVLVDDDDCDDDCIGWDVLSGYLVHWNFTVDEKRKHSFLNANLFLRAMLTDQTIEEMEQQVGSKIKF